MHEEGRVLQIESDSFLHEFVLRDHLGNVQVVFNDQYPDGLIKEHLGEIQQEHHYYPFGLEWGPVYGNPPTAGNSIPWYWQAGDDEHRFRYNGKEFHGHEINWLDYGARWYDPVIGRWGQVDPLAEDYASWSPYNYVMGNPIKLIDPDGRSIESTIVEENQDGTFSVVGGDPNDGDKGIYIDNGSGGKGEKLGESLTSHSFFGDDDQAIVGAVIDLNSTEGQDFLESEIVAPDIGLAKYIANAKGGEPLDFKTRDKDSRPEGMSLEQYVYRGSVTSSGKIGSARDFGNIGAGIVAGRNGLGWGDARLGFDGLQSIQEGRLATEGARLHNR